jgi:hypothetical protein
MSKHIQIAQNSFNLNPSGAATAGFVILLICLASIASPAQVLYGSLTGTVTDPSGAAVAGVRVEAVNLATSVSQTASTDTSGIYRFVALQAGDYKVTMSQAGFATVINSSVPIVANTLRRVDTQLELAKHNETVTVTAEATLLQADRPDVHTDLTSNEISNLPITSSVHGRNFQALLRVVPGVGLLAEQNSAAGNPQRAMTANVNGQSIQGINTRIDGAADAYPWLPANVAYVPPADAVETVNVVTNSFDAEQGMAGGAAVNVQIKSGTNQFHGEGFEFGTDNALRTRNYFQTDPTRFPRKPKNVLNQYGGTFGGPIIKEKLFFFGDYQRTTQRGIGTPTFTLPTTAMRTGDFRGLVDSKGNPVIIYDPATGDANGNGRSQISCNGVLNMICPDRIDPASSAMVALLPGLTSPNATTNNYVASGTGQYNVDDTDVKINYNPKQKMMVFGRYSISRSHIFDPPALGAAGGDATNGGQQGNADSRIQSVGLGGTYAFTPTLLFDWNAAFTRQRLGATNVDINSQYGLDTLHIPGTNAQYINGNVPGDSTLYGGIPFFQTSGMANLGNSNVANPFVFRDNQYVTGENLSWIHGKHAFRFGFEFDHVQMNHFQPQGADGNFTSARGSFNFNGDLTAASSTAAVVNPFNSFAQFLLGLSNRAGKDALLFNPIALRWSTIAWYARDQWQVDRKLTLTLGVRWEYYPFGYGDNGHGLPYFNPSNGNVYIGGEGSVPIDSTMNVGNGQFLPRVGFAYRLTNRTVIRGGYGMSADPNQWHYLRNSYPGNITTDPGNANGNLPEISLTGTNATAPSYGTIPVGLTPILVPLPDISSGVLPLPVGASTRDFANPFRRGYINSFNFTVQQEVAGFSAEAAYVGSRGIRPLTNLNENGAPVCPATVVGRSSATCVAAGFGEPLSTSLGRKVGDDSQLTPFGNSYYDSLQAKLTRRIKGGSVVGVSYTFSKAIDYSDNEDLNGSFENYPAYYFLNRSLASFDRPQNVQIYAAYALPFGKGQRFAQNGIVNKLAGGWQINGTLSKLSGTPFNVVGNAGLLNPNSSRGLTETLVQVAPFRVTSGKPWSGTGVCPNASCQYFSPADFTQPTAGNLGNTRRDEFRGPGIFDMDLSLFRNFRISERFTFQFRAEGFGITNTPRFQNPGNGTSTCSGPAGGSCVVASSTFGDITGTLGTSGSNSSTDGARNIWFAGKLIF